jgi:hypothetical protein
MSDDEFKLSERIHDSLLKHIVETLEQLTERVVVDEADTHKKIDFILDQQAQLVAKAGELADAQTNAERRWERTEGSIRNLLAIAELQSGEIRELGEAVRVIDGRQREAAERQRDADERQREADERQREAAERQREADERQRHSDERLNALINTVERIISERKNGQA